MKLFEYFKEDKKLFYEAFLYGKFFVYAGDVKKSTTSHSVLLRLGHDSKKDTLHIIDKKSERYYMRPYETMRIGDVVFIAHDDADENGESFFERVGTILTEEAKDKSEKELKKILKKFPRKKG